MARQRLNWAATNFGATILPIWCSIRTENSPMGTPGQNCVSIAAKVSAPSWPRRRWWSDGALWSSRFLVAWRWPHAAQWSFEILPHAA